MKYILTSFSVFLIFVILEFSLRIFFFNSMNYEIEMMKYAKNFKQISLNKKIGIEHKKNISGQLMGAKIFLDENGFRTNSEKSKLNEKNKKILMLGDSMTFGWGSKKTFSGLLNEKFSSYDILNAGIGNTNTIMQVNNFFENFSIKYKYEMIVLNFFINDFENIQIRNPNFFQKHSYLYTFLNNKINTILIKFGTKKDWKSFYSESYLNLEVKKETLFLINKLNNFCKNNNIKFVIHNIPELRDLNNYRFDKETKIIRDFAKSKNILYLNSFESLKKHKAKSLWVTLSDPHANDYAHSIMADYLFLNFKKILN